MTLRSGVVVALAAPADRERVFAVCAARRAEAERFSAGERDVVAAFGFGVDAQTVVAVSHIGAAATTLRPDLALASGTAARDALRIDGFTEATAPADAVRAEVLLARLARDLAEHFGGVVCDDVGAVYARAELDELARDARPRELSRSFASAVVDRADEVVALQTISVISDCAPDVALDVASIFIFADTNLPLVATRRVRAVRAAAPAVTTIVYAPQLRERDVSALVATGAAVARDASELEAAIGTAAGGRRIRELLAPSAYARSERSTPIPDRVDVDSARRAVAEIAFASGALSTIVDEAMVPVDGCVRLARCAFDGTIVDVYRVSDGPNLPAAIACESLIASASEPAELFARAIVARFEAVA